MRTCVCEDDWDGDYCEVKSCRKNPNFCDGNGKNPLTWGRCFVEGDNLKCDCHPGWGGDKCNTVSCDKITYCNPNGIF